MRCSPQLALAVPLALAPALALAFSAFARVSSGGPDGPGGATSGVRLEAALTGEAEVPGPGDPDFDLDPIEADVFVNPRKETLCFEIDLEDGQDDALDAVVAAHIHAGPAGVADEDRVLIDLDFASRGLRGCVRAGRHLLQSILDDLDDIEGDGPKVSQFYLHLHTAGFPAGAVRGQLER